MRYDSRALTAAFDARLREGLTTSLSPFPTLAADGWIIGACREASGRPMATRLAHELMAAYKKEGKAIQIRENTHRMAEANKAFAHFAW